MPNSSRYRQVDFLGEKILQARELNLMQSIAQGYTAGGNVSSYMESAQYRQGALLNVTFNVTGSNVVMSPTNSSYPMLIFIRDRWESILNIENITVSLSPSTLTIYVNWQLALITSVQDSSLVDITTLEPTADMGELQLSFSTADTSAVALSSSQLAKNTSPVPIANFEVVGGVYVLQPFDNVNPPALASNLTSGLVSLTTGTSGGLAVATDDTRMTNARAVIDGSVHDSSVRSPVGTNQNNADGTPTYDLTVDIGGISAAKIILQATTQRLSDAWTYLTNVVTSLLGNFNAHATAILGLSNTHPIPTPSQVGAAPASHVGLPLGLSTSHPPQVNANSGGFSVNRTVGATVNPSDPAFGLLEGSTLISALFHDGDIYCGASSAVIATPGGVGALASGPLGNISLIAKILSQHVNQVSHGNPHGLTLSDLGGVSTGVLNAAITGVLQQANTYSASIVPTVTLRTENVSQGSYVILRFAPNGANTTQAAIEFAVGAGTIVNGGSIPVPANFSTTNALFNVSVGQYNLNSVHTDQIHFYNTGALVTAVAGDHSSEYGAQAGTANWMGVCWRTNA